MPLRHASSNPDISTIPTAKTPPHRFMNIAKMMKQAQQMQDNLKKMQEQLALVEVEGQSGAGLVKVLITCRNEIKRVTIDPSLVGEDRDMLEDLVVSAVNDALRRAEQTAQRAARLVSGKAFRKSKRRSAHPFCWRR